MTKATVTVTQPSLLALGLIFSLVPLGPLAIDIFLPSIPQMVQSFASNDQALQMTIPIYVFALGISQLVAGPLSDRYGRRFSAITGLGLYALGSVIATQVTELNGLYTARILQGFGASFTMVTAMAWVRDNYEGETAAKWLSYMGGITGVIPTLAPLLGSGLAYLWGWQAGFYAMATIAVLLLLLAIPALSNASTPEDGSIPQHAHRIPLRQQLSTILGNPQFRIYALSNLFSFGALLSYIATAPIAAITEGGKSELWFAIAFGLIGFCQLLMSFAAPKLVTMIGQRNTIITGLSLSSTAGLSLMLLPNQMACGFFFLAALGCGGFSLQVGAATAMVLQPFKQSAGLATSLEGFSRMVGGALIAAGVSSLTLDSSTTLAIALLFTLLPLFLISRKRLIRQSPEN